LHYGTVYAHITNQVIKIHNTTIMLLRF